MHTKSKGLCGVYLFQGFVRNSKESLEGYKVPPCHKNGGNKNV